MTTEERTAWAALHEAKLSLEKLARKENGRNLRRNALVTHGAIAKERAADYLIDPSILQRVEAHILFLSNWTSRTSGHDWHKSGLQFVHAGISKEDYETAPWREHFVRHLDSFRRLGLGVTESWNGEQLTIAIK